MTTNTFSCKRASIQQYHRGDLDPSDLDPDHPGDQALSQEGGGEAGTESTKNNFETFLVVTHSRIIIIFRLMA